MSTPQEHIADAHKLTADGYVDLFEIALTSGAVVRLKADNDVTWQGNTYEGIGILLQEAARTSDNELSRPTLVVGNPDGAFLPLVRDGLTDNALVTRYRVLKAHIDADVNIYNRNKWRIKQVKGANKRSLTFELRDQTDGQFFLIPGRQYTPPDFPTVSLQ